MGDLETHTLAPLFRHTRWSETEWSETPLNGPRVLALFSVEVSDIAEGESVALVLGTRDPIAMSPPSPTCPRWSLSVVLPSESRKDREGVYSRSDFVVRCNYSYGIIGADGQLKRREEGGGRRLMADGTPHLVFVKDTYGMWEGKRGWVSLKPAEASAPTGPSESFVFGSSPPPALYATVPPDQPPTFPDRVKIWRPSSAWSDGTPNVIDFRGASQLTRQLVVHIACNAISEGSARDLIHRGAEAKQLVMTAWPSTADRDMSLPQLAAEHLDEPEAVGVMRVLLDAGAPILPPTGHSDRDSAVHTAAVKGKWRVLDVMLEPQDGISVAGHRLVAAVCRSKSSSADKLRVVKMLGERDVTVLSEKGDDGWRPIHHFSSRPLRKEKLQKQLIDYFAEKLGADVVNTPVQVPPVQPPAISFYGDDGSRPLSLAHLTYGTYRNRADATIERLYRYGAARHINTPDSQGNTVLRNAAARSECPNEALVGLLEHGASVATAGLTQALPGGRPRGLIHPGERPRLLTAYSAFLNESIPRLALQTINEALRPSRSLVASLTQPIPLRSRTIALPSDVLTIINSHLAPTSQTDSPPPPIPIGDEPIGTRINQAVHQYVTVAARVICQPVQQQQQQERHGNVRVVGGAGLAPLRCFAVGGAAQPQQHMGVCEVIARAVRLEASRYGIGLTLRHNVIDDTHVLGALAVV
ncbi:unnamed protein product [Vitrella brassicaformis CCMP3155]|uniref:Uncharacterized protein n=1 Tax=Vitrella brassicaformis (strain CCMP3155) TaxID=1169540 RepID=A0A0G4FJY9_VITBC|nr:unnamed protein product [Vitrella brassicaformis CCMP3155]|eukprot:CEM14087.1 unnamed protein product [Vitrella brassicaformis CCMP3155]